MSESPGGWASPGGELPAGPPVGSDPVSPAGWQGPAGWPASAGWGPPADAGPQPGVVPLRPLGLGELLDGAVALIRRYPRPVLGLSAALAIFAAVVDVTLAVTALRPLIAFDTSRLADTGSANADQLNGFVGGAAVGALGTGLVSALTTLVLTGLLTVLAGRGVLGQPMTLAQAWAQFRPALPRLLGIAGLTALLVYGSLIAGVTVAVLLLATVGGAFALLGIPLALAAGALAVYLYCRLALAPCVAVLERAGVRTSLRRSGVLVRRSWWRVFGVLLLTLVVASVVSQVVQVPFLLFGVGTTGLRSTVLTQGSTRLLVLTSIGGAVAQTLVAPFTAGVRALLYVDRRMRAEALDVTLVAAAARSAP